MGKQDDWIRKTVRLPVELHEQLTRAAKTSSINAEIVTRLERSFHESTSRDISSSIELIIHSLQILDEADRDALIAMIIKAGARLSHRND